MLAILRTLQAVSVYGSHILLTGESGTGKDLLAQYIHRSGNRKDNPFIKVDCNSLPVDLIESELFGHEKGAFTGAYQQRTGKFEMADTGLVYLDQIGDLPLLVQSKLTRVIQEKFIERIGSNRKIPIDIQVISSSRTDLTQRVRTGSFRDDLYYRLSVVPISIPPLRDRKEDIPLLSNHFIRAFSFRYGTSLLELHPSTVEYLQNYHWPGNVRELENIIERLCINNSGHGPVFPDDVLLDTGVTVRDVIETGANQMVSLEEMEKMYIQLVLRITKGNKSTAAHILGINRKTLLEKRRKYKLP